MESESPNRPNDRSAGRTVRLLFLIGIVVVSLNLRPAIVSISPLLEQIRADIVVSYTIISLLTTIPTVTMGVFAFFAPWVARRVGRSRATLIAIGLLLVAVSIRVAAINPFILFGSTLVAGIGIATGQAYLPALVGEYYPDRVGFATGLYSTSLIIGAGLAAGVTVPIRDFLGSWPLALAAWAVPLGIALLVWTVFVLAERRSIRNAGSSEPQTESSDQATRGLPWRNRTAWLTVLIFGGQAALFYAVVTWLPPLYVNEGVAAERAGFILLTMFAVMPVASLVFSTILDRVRYRRLPFLAALVFMGIGILVVAVIPMYNPFLWSVVLGTGIGGLFPLSLTLPVDHAANPDASQQLTSMTFGIGYLIGATGPLIAGFLRDTFGNFVMAFLGLGVVVGLVFLLALQLTEARFGVVE